MSIRTPILLLFFLLFQLSLFAQNHVDNVDKFLVLKHSESSKQRILSENKRIKIWLGNSEEDPIKGRFTILNDSIIKINDQQFNISKIAKLRTSRLATKIVGGVLAVPGTSLILIGGGAIINALIVDASTAAFAIIIGGISIVLGIIPAAIGIPLLLSGKKYDIKEKWSLSVQ